MMCLRRRRCRIKDHRGEDAILRLNHMAVQAPTFLALEEMEGHGILARIQDRAVQCGGHRGDIIVGRTKAGLHLEFCHIAG